MSSDHNVAKNPHWQKLSINKIRKKKKRIKQLKLRTKKNKFCFEVTINGGKAKWKEEGILVVDS